MSESDRVDIVNASLGAAVDAIGDARYAYDALVSAAQNVVDSWESGDLAGAVSDLAGALDA